MSGRNRAPNNIQCSTMAAIINSAPRHVYVCIKYSVNGANRNVPNPEPHTAIPEMKCGDYSNFLINTCNIFLYLWLTICIFQSML